MEEVSYNFTDMELLYSATARCRCGAGLAYPLETAHAMKLGAWACSAVLTGAVSGPDEKGKHIAYPWSMYKIREETSVNNVGAHSTRPPGSVARTVCKAKCPRCGRAWSSEPYNAAELGRNAATGPCPSCGYSVGAGHSHNSADGAPIDARFPHVVLADDRASLGKETE